MKSIVTLTVDPSVDISAEVRHVTPGRKLRCGSSRREPGGGGVSAARAIQRLGGEAMAMYLAGGPSGALLGRLLDDAGVPHRAVPIDEWTRENLIVREAASGSHYRFELPGPKVTEREWRRCLRELASLEPAPDYLIAGGLLPTGVPKSFFGHVAEVARERGSRLVVDSSGEPLRHAVEVGTFMLKLNVREFRGVVDDEVSGEPEQVAAARRLIERGRVEVVVLSLGAGGALLVTADAVEPVRSPAVPVRSRMGAGDSMVGGMVLALARGWELLPAVRFGVAAGAAAVMNESAELCRREDAERLYAEMERGPGGARATETEGE